MTEPLTCGFCDRPPEEHGDSLTDAEKVAVEVVEHWLDGRIHVENGSASAAMLRLRRSLPDEAFKTRRFINGG